MLLKNNKGKRNAENPHQNTLFLQVFSVLATKILFVIFSRSFFVCGGHFPCQEA